MMVQIKYLNGCFDMVKTSNLDRLIAAQKISSFKRQDNWVILGQNPVRDLGEHAYYIGAERRNTAINWPEAHNF